MPGSFSRRRLLTSSAIGSLSWMLPKPIAGAPFPIRLRKAPPYESLFAYIEPGHDEFAAEKRAADITAHLERLPQTRSLPLGGNFQGFSPLPARYRPLAADIAQAEFDPTNTHFAEGLEKWLDSLGDIRNARYFVLPGDRVRYEVASSGPAGLQYRVGVW